jgi:hypothetical protein
VVLSGNRHSILQESLPTIITAKRLKDTPFFSGDVLSARQISNTDGENLLRPEADLGAC